MNSEKEPTVRIRLHLVSSFFIIKILCVKIQKSDFENITADETKIIATGSS